MDNSFNLGSPRKAKGLIADMLFPSRDILRNSLRPLKASLRMTLKLFLVSERCSTVEGNVCRGISMRPPVLHSTWNNGKY